MNRVTIEHSVAMRGEIALLRAPHPEQIPALATLESLPQTQGWHESMVAVRQAINMGLHEPVLLAQVNTALAIDQARGPNPHTSSATADSHDVYFRIERTQGQPERAYVQMVLHALQRFLQEAHSSGATQAYATIGHALMELWCEVMGMEVPTEHKVLLPPTADHTPAAQAPIQRWVFGHHIFAALTQGLIRTYLRLEGSHSGDTRSPSTRQLIQRLERLYRASAASFRFTADFDPTFYTDVIRPSMTEPYVPKGFSGTLSVDHRHLVQVMVRQQALLSTARAHWPREYEAMTQALALVYDEHKWVCARFEGDHKPSLRTDSVKGQQTAVDMIDRFKNRRIDMLS